MKSHGIIPLPHTLDDAMYQLESIRRKQGSLSHVTSHHM